ncbi:hypothetical protein RRG08_060909 [Elysia crispata]|uniref:N-acetylneuraminate lyase n=1 Tax=Elysia crispata TaxID=231223 RepID=A0AAE1D8F4_9GAST|nr:hypothetical protein RRG08_060909 [Elysia crispata]
MDQRFSDFKVKGAIAAPATALKKNGDVNPEKVKDYVDFLIKNEIDGVFILGTLGEGMSFTVAERKQMAEAWVHYGKDRLSTVVVHVGTGNIRDSIDLARHAEQIKASAIACLCPSYYKPENEEAVVDYIEQVAAAAPNTPFYYYCINFVTGIYLNSARVMELASKRIPTLRGIKFSSREILTLFDCRQLCGGALDLMIGSDEQFLAALSLGIRTPVLNGPVGPIFKRLLKAFDAGDMETATQEQVNARKLKDVFNKYGGNPAAVKAIARCFGLDLGPVRLPLHDLPEVKLPDLRKDLQDIGILNEE